MTEAEYQERLVALDALVAGLEHVSDDLAKVEQTALVGLCGDPFDAYMNPTLAKLHEAIAHVGGALDHAVVRRYRLIRSQR